MIIFVLRFHSRHTREPPTTLHQRQSQSERTPLRAGPVQLAPDHEHRELPAVTDTARSRGRWTIPRYPGI